MLSGPHAKRPRHEPHPTLVHPRPRSYGAYGSIKFPTYDPANVALLNRCACGLALANAEALGARSHAAEVWGVPTAAGPAHRAEVLRPTLQLAPNAYTHTHERPLSRRAAAYPGALSWRGATSGAAASWGPSGMKRARSSRRWAAWGGPRVP